MQRNMADDQVQQVESTMAESVPAEQPIGPQSTTASEDVNMPEINVAEPDDDPKSQKVTLADLSAKGNALFAQRKYEEASEILSEASNLQAELNGETASNNAEILFLYGRCLFKVGQSKSNVLGGAAAAPAPKKSGAANGKGTKQKKVVETSTEEVNEEGGAGDAEQTGEAKVAAEGVDAKKPLFQFTGDENFDESDEDENAEDADGEEQEEDEDELSIAFEILDLARVCYQKQLDEAGQEDTTGTDKGKETGDSKNDSSAVRHIKERLADTHDALAEISLENEKYPNAIEDGRTSLQYKLSLYPEESEIVAEAHYKLSLALEFASVTTAEGDTAKREDMDQELRDEAVKEMELAIKSFKLKMQNKEVELATMASPEDNDALRRSITDMKEVIADMDQRLVDLKDGPIDTKGLLGEDTGALGGLLGGILGESSSETKARIDEATRTATDLTNLVRKRKPKEEEVKSEEQNGASVPEAAANSNGDGLSHKRKASATGVPGSPKKAKVEDEPESEQV